MSHGSGVPGLRERKKSATRDAIAAAALELFAQNGFEQTTIAAIAHAAGVSPRTVSAYFPVKEDLAFPDNAAAFERLATLLRTRPRGESTGDAMRTWFRGELEGWRANADRVCIQRRVIAGDERLRHHERLLMERAEQLLAEAIAQDLGQDPGALEPRMAAAATVAMFHVIGADHDAELERGEDPRAVGSSETLALLDRVLGFVGAGVGSFGRSPDPAGA